MSTPSPLNSPYGGELVNLLVSHERAAEMKAESQGLAAITLDERGLCDIELLATGGFSPLRTFMNRADYERVLREQRLADGTFWPLPITLPVTPGEGVSEGKPLALRDVFGNLLAFLHVEDIYPVDIAAEALFAQRTSTQSHYSSGRLEVIRVPPHYDFTDIRRTPYEVREAFHALGWSKVAAYHSRTPMHRAHEAMTRRAAEQIGGGLLIQPIVGMTRPGDVDHYTRVRCFRALVDNACTPGSMVLNLLPYESRGAGERDVLLHAILGRNYGCSDLIVGPDDAPVGELADHAQEIGIGFVRAEPMVYVPEANRYEAIDSIPTGTTTGEITEREVRENYLAKGLPLPEWFTPPAVSAILNEANPPKFRQGLTIWFTGLSGSGKSTVAHALVERLAEYGRNVSMLDGDEIRTHLSKGLSFSKEDRDININRVGYVAGLVAQHGGTTLCSVISPYRAPRENARKASKGNFVEVFCDTPIAICETRDVKGLYAKARIAVAEGKGMAFTGVDDPYEAPLNPEVTIDTSTLGVKECADAIIDKLLELGYILPHGHASA